MELTTQDFYNLYWGGSHVTENSRYLWPQVNQDENGDEYNRRRKRSAYPNFQFKIVNIYKDYVMFNKGESSDSPRINIRQLAAQMIVDTLVGGWAWVVVTKSFPPAIYEGFRLNVKDDGTIIINSGEVVNGQLRKGGDFILITEDFSQIEIHQKDNETPIVEPFNEQQLIKCKWSPDEMSLIRDTASINVQLYNIWSILNELALHAGSFVTAGADIGSDKASPFMHINLGPGETFDFYSPDVSPMPLLREEIKNRVMEMSAIVGLTREFNEELKIQPSGLSLAFQMLDTNATVAQIAKNMNACCNQVAAVDQAVNGGAKAEIRLEPILNPLADTEKLTFLRDLEQTLKLDEIQKEVQKAKVRMALGNLPDGRLEELMQLIETQGGVAAMSRPELMFDSMLGAAEQE